jgi:tRNA threonylcarbamoyladenosine biosynthesis protein TsaE
LSEPSLRLESDSPGRTEAVGAELAARLGAGDVVLVAGDLGSGKTTLIRGACRALGVSEPITSPTFTLGARYRGRLRISHLDLYRLEDVEEEVPGLLDDYLTPDAVVFVEWPAGAGTRLAATVRVEIEHTGGDRRRIAIATDRYRAAPDAT